jgi:hypothetical protein
LEQRAINHAENGCRAPDAKFQCQGGCGDKVPIAAQPAQAMTDVPCEVLHKVAGTYCANPILHLLDPASLDERFSPGHCFRKPLLHLLLDQGVQHPTEFIIERLLHSSACERDSETNLESAWA